METIPLICRANQCTGLYMITAFVMKGLTLFYFVPSTCTYDLQCYFEVMLFY